ncbi:hypothetical protein GCM10028774_25900 [Spirosoma jeollabukense]
MSPSPVPVRVTSDPPAAESGMSLVATGLPGAIWGLPSVSFVQELIEKAVTIVRKNKPAMRFNLVNFIGLLVGN